MSVLVTEPVPAAQTLDRRWLWGTLAAVTAAGSGATHVQAAVDHVGHGPGHVAFFVVVPPPRPSPRSACCGDPGRPAWSSCWPRRSR